MPRPRLFHQRGGTFLSDQPQPALGKAIRQLRDKRGMTQEALAHVAGVTVGHLSMIERGHSNPTWGTIKGIAKAFDTPMGDLAKLADRLDAS